jgi:flagellar basal body rod protein FlgG
VLFSDWLIRLAVPMRRGANHSAYTGSGAWRDQRVGTLTHTGSPFDLGITSDGFFISAE